MMDARASNPHDPPVAPTGSEERLCALYSRTRFRFTLIEMGLVLLFLIGVSVTGEAHQLDEALDRTRLTAENASITISTDRPSGLEILGDRTLLVSALTNLIENAIAYSPAGSPVTISRSLRDGKVAMTRPLCPHPQVARYKGRGDTNVAASFECAKP